MQNKIKTLLFKVIPISFFSVTIVACSQTNPARINDISGSSTNINQTSHGSTKSTYSKPPSNIASTNTRKPIEEPAYSRSVEYQDDSVITTTKERIVYNRNYDEIPKGGYKGNTYTVKRGDTLFYVAWITGNDFRSLAAKNDIKSPYALNVGQVLDVSGGNTIVTKQTKTTENNKKPIVTTTTTTTTTGSSESTVINQKSMTVRSTTLVPTATVAHIQWQWPAKGKVVEKFNSTTKGIDIAGSLGDKIVAAADGKVVYAGNALSGYGNLIIIKHNDDYLTAYAHNQSILVKEQQSVKAGQQIATMGNTGTSSIRLHFEIRYKAKSVNPLEYLP